MIIILSLLSAVLHPIRDIILKNNHPRYETYMLSVTGLIPIAIVNILIVHSGFHISKHVLELCLLSAFGNVLFYGGIAFALKFGDLSVYFPIFRGTPLFVAIVNYFVWDQKYSFYFWIGLIFIILGVFIIYNGIKFWQFYSHLTEDEEESKNQPPKHGHLKPLLFSILALFGSILFILADDHAMDSTNILDKIEPSTYQFYNYSLCAGLFFIFGFLKSKDKIRYIPKIIKTYTGNFKRLFSASLLDYSSYTLILLAESMHGDVVFVNSLRLWDIPVSVLLARFFLKEKNTTNRLMASFLILIGSVVIIYS